jgi:hypothetical protein
MALLAGTKPVYHVAWTSDRANVAGLDSQLEQHDDRRGESWIIRIRGDSHGRILDSQIVVNAKRHALLGEAEDPQKLSC